MPYAYTLPKGYAEEEITGVIAESLASQCILPRRPGPMVGQYAVPQD
jgi:hypothetical protein